MEHFNERFGWIEANPHGQIVNEGSDNRFNTHLDCCVLLSALERCSIGPDLLTPVASG